MCDLYFFREQDEIEKDEMALIEKEQKESEQAQQAYQQDWGGEQVNKLPKRSFYALLVLRHT